MTPTGTGNARNRLGANARGFICLDGKRIADDQASMFDAASPKIYQAPMFDETGAAGDRRHVLTGTLPTGATGNNCNNWNGTASSLVALGSDIGGGASWTAWATNINGCPSSFAGRLLCVMKVNAVAISPPPAMNGKRIVLSNGAHSIGATTPDQRCASEAGPGYRAFLSTSTTAASGVIAATTMYVRPDGTPLGTGADISPAAGSAVSGARQRKLRHNRASGLDWSRQANQHWHHSNVQ